MKHIFCEILLNYCYYKIHMFAIIHQRSLRVTALAVFITGVNCNSELYRPITSVREVYYFVLQYVDGFFDLEVIVDVMAQKVQSKQ